jgi:hypothetical protein
LMKCYIATILIALCLLTGCSEPVSEKAHMPIIRSFGFSRSHVYIQEYIEVQASVTDSDKSDKLTYKWSATGGIFTNPTNTLTQWHAPDIPDNYTIKFTVSDGYFSVDTSGVVNVLAKE